MDRGVKAYDLSIAYEVFQFCAFLLRLAARAEELRTTWLGDYEKWVEKADTQGGQGWSKEGQNADVESREGDSDAVKARKEERKRRAELVSKAKGTGKANKAQAEQAKADLASWAYLGSADALQPAKK